MRVLLIGTGGVGTCIAKLAAQRDRDSEWLEKMVLADCDVMRAGKVAKELGDDERFPVEHVDAGDKDKVKALLEKHKVDVVMNAVDPVYNMPIFDAAFESGVKYIDMASSLSKPDPEDPYNKCGVLLGDLQWAQAERWEQAGNLAMLGCGTDPGMSDFFAKYAELHYFDEIEEVGVRDGHNLTVPGSEDVSFSFSIWTILEECLNPPVVWEKDRGLFTTEPFSEPETFWLPEGIGPVDMVNVEHVEVIYFSRHIDKGLKRATFKYGLGEQFVEALKVLKACGMHSTKPVRVRGMEVVPREVLAAAAENPMEIAKRQKGKVCAGTWVKGIKDGLRREVFIYQVQDNEESLERTGVGAAQTMTAFLPAMLLELIGTGRWEYTGVRCPELCDPHPVFSLMDEYGFGGALMEMDSEYKRAKDAAALRAPLVR
jgi:saccharopine dehydrogenase-like NADP-dependent oxidoreductase